MPSSPIRAVVFDLDGLMFNTEDVFFLAGSELLRRRGFEMTREIMTAIIGRRPHEGFTILVERLALKESVEGLLAESTEIFFGLLNEHLRPMPGLHDFITLVESLKLPKGVATSSRRGYLEDLLGRFSLQSRFGMTLAAEDVTQGKPNPEIYLLAASRLGVAPHEMLVLEDSEAGTRAGVTAGAVVVSIPHSHTAHHSFDGAALIAEGLHDPRIAVLLGVTK